jgi:hypothetical protein
MTTHFKDNKEQVTCTGGSLDGRELWITAGLGSFVVLGREGVRETFARETDGRFVLVRDVRGATDSYMPCSQ